MTALMITPPNVGLFICDLPAYYAVGDHDSLMLFRGAELTEVTEYDGRVQAHLSKYPDLKLFVRRHFDNPNVPADKHTVLIYATSEDALPDSRLHEYLEPLSRASDRGAARYVRAVLA